MFRRILPIAYRNLPTLMKISALSLGFLTLKHYSKFNEPIQCSFHLPKRDTNVFLEVLPKIIRIEHNGEIIGWAYCFNEGQIVTSSHQLLEHKFDIKQYEFFIGDYKIQSKFKIIGKFENLTFIQSQDRSIPILPSKQLDLYSPVHIVRYNSYLSIRDGYYVANDSGFGVINGKGEVGSLAVNNDGIVGIVSQIGRDTDYGFIRVILWKDVKNIANRLKKSKEHSIYLGMSVVALTERNGLSIVRVAPNSPLSNHFKMGDIVTKVNSHTVRNPDDLVRIIMSSDKTIVFEVEDPNKNKRLITVQM